MSARLSGSVLHGTAGRWVAHAARGLWRRILILERRLTARHRARRTVREERLLVTELGGWRLYYPSSSIIGRAIAEGAGWEATLATSMDLLLPREGPLQIAEVGSNIGATLAQMISVRPSARYVCFEPAERFRSVLVQNVAENGWDNVTIEDVLLGARAETVRLFTNTSTASVAKRHYGGHAFLGTTKRYVTRLDDYFAGTPRLDMIKTDTDGFDTDVLLGARSLLSRLSPILYFEFAPFLARSAGRAAGELLEYLDGLGYRRFLVFAQAGGLLSLTEDPADVVRLAEEHQYVDVLTAAQSAHVEAFPQIAAATAEKVT